MNDRTKADSARAKSRQGSSQAAIDSARAKSRQGGGQTASDTARAKSRTQADTARAKSRQNGGDGGTAGRMSQREAASGLYLAGNDTMSGRVGLQAPKIPTASNPRKGNVDRNFDDFSPPEGGASSTLSIHALQLVRFAVDTLCVRQGTIGSIIPTIGGTELESDLSENVLSIPGTATREYWLNVTVASGAVTAVSIVTAEPGADSETQAKLLLGSVETNSGDIIAFNSNLSGSQSFASCGSTHFFGVV